MDKPPAKRRWAELAWMIKVWLVAALVLLILELTGIHEGGLLLRMWTRLFGPGE